MVLGMCVRSDFFNHTTREVFIGNPSYRKESERGTIALNLDNCLHLSIGAVEQNRP